MKRDLINTLISKFYVVFGSFFLVIHTANYMGALNRGILGATLVIVGFSQTIFYMSLGQIIYTKIVNGKNKIEVDYALSQIKSYNFFVVPIIAVFISFLLSLYEIFSVNLLVISLLCVMTLIVEQQLTSISLARGLSNQINKIQILSKTIYFLLSYFLVFYTDLNYYGILFGYLFSNLVSVLMLRRISKKVFYDVYSLLPFSFNFIPILKEAIKFHINAFGQALFTQAPLLIVGFFVALEKLANVELAFKIIGVYFVVGQATQQVILSKISQVNEKDAVNIIKKLMRYSVFFLAISSVIGVVLIDFFVNEFLSSEFHDVSIIFKSLIPIVVPFCLNMTLLSAYVRFELFVLASKNNMIIGVVSSLSSVVFCYLFNSYGFIISCYITSLVMLYFVIKVIKDVDYKVTNENSIFV